MNLRLSRFSSKFLAVLFLFPACGQVCVEPSPYIPVISLQALHHGNDETRQEEIEKLRLAIHDSGVFHVTDLSSSAHDVVEMASTSGESFFNMPLERKKDSQPHDKKARIRGYIPNGQESGSDLREMKEAFSYGSVLNDKLSGSASGNPRENQEAMAAPNIWPEESDAPNFRSRMNDLYDLSVMSAEKIAAGFEAALELPKDHFRILTNTTAGELSARRISLMRLFRYLPVDNTSNVDSDFTGSSPHTDWGFLTLVFVSRPGLELFYNGQWFPVPLPPPGGAVCNVGDWMALQYRGVVSPRHRVVGRNATEEDRLSFVFFYYPNFDATFQFNSDLVDASILTDQRPKGERDRTDVKSTQVESGSPRSFGAWVASKWEEVSREATNAL